MQQDKIKKAFDIFKITFGISSFTFGGGYIVIPMMRKYFVKDLKLISEEELMNNAAIAQSSPGAIAVNLAALIGYKSLNIAGAIIATLGTIIPPLIILSIISLFYSTFKDNHFVSIILKGMETGVAASIVDLLLDMYLQIIKQKNILLTLLTPIAFILNFIFKINVIYIILLTILIICLQMFLKGKNY